MANIPIKPTGQSFDISATAKNAISLKAGQIIEGKVINATRESFATLLINNKNVEVKTELYLKKGRDPAP